MSLRQKILLMISLTIVLTVASVGWAVAVRVAVLFDGQDRDRMAALVNQFVREYARRAEDVANRVQRVARDGRVARMEDDLAHGKDTSVYAGAGGAVAREYGLDFLELTEPDGTVLSSAQWPTHLGVQDESAAVVEPAPYLKREPLAGDKSEIGVFANRTAGGSDDAAGLEIVGGERLDGSFLSGISAPAGSMVYLYRNVTPGFVEANLIGAGGGVANAARYRELIDQVRSTGAEVTSEILRRNSEEQSVALRAVPLKAVDGSVVAVLLVANSRDALIEGQEHIRAVAYGVAAIGILFAVMVSLWIAASVSRPVEQLAAGAREVAGGNWDVNVPVRSSSDEIATLGVAFNKMTKALGNERERLIQCEQVAGAREVSRGLARAIRELYSEEKVAVMPETARLTDLVTRLEEFSTETKPHMSRMDLREVAADAKRLNEPMLRSRSEPVHLILDMPDDPLVIDGDQELLQRAVSKLVLSAVEVMNRPGTVTLAAGRMDGFVRLLVSDMRPGITEQECERIFTQYATGQGHGMGLDLANVQAIIADHHGTICVQSSPGHGTTFRIDLPPAATEPEKTA